jgi:hypothetical protein
MRNTVLIAIATFVTAAAVILLAAMPIRADRQAPLVRRDGPVNVMKLMRQAKDLPIQQFDDLM